MFRKVPVRNSYVSRLAQLALIAGLAWGLIGAALASHRPGHGGGGGPPADPAIAFVQTGTTDKLMVMNADGSNATVIHSVQGILGPPSWSPDGRAVAFVEGSSLWRIDVAVVNGVPQGSNLTLLLANQPSVPRNFSIPAWSPLGDGIVVVQIESPAELWVVPASGGMPEVVYQAPPGEGLRSPTWSPDGTRIAFRHGTSTAEQIDIVDRDTGQVTTALALGSEWTIRFIDWVRTGDTLAFDLQLDTGGPTDLYTLDLATGAVTQVVSEGFAPSWSPDDSELIYTKTTGGGARKMAKVNLATGAVTTLKVAGNWPDWRRF